MLVQQSKFMLQPLINAWLCYYRYQQEQVRRGSDRGMLETILHCLGNEPIKAYNLHAL